MEDEGGLVEKFCGVTTSTPEQAIFFLESTEWLLEPALQFYFESDHGEQVRETSINLADYDLTEDENWSIPEPDMIDQDNLIQGSILSHAWNSVNHAQAEAEFRSPPQPIGCFWKGPTRSRGEEGNDRRDVTSGDDVTGREGLGKSNDTVFGSDDQGYTTADHSGMVVQDPNKKYGHGDVEVMYERLPKLGEQVGVVAESHRPCASVRNSSYTNPSQGLSGKSRQRQRGSVHQPVARDSPPDRTIRNLRNGGILVQDNLANKSAEVRQEPLKHKSVPFKEPGHTLETSKAAASNALLTNAAHPQPSSQGVIVDETKPATSVKLRLMDGTRLVACFNIDHTVADIRGFIDHARPGSSGVYQLQTMGFPPMKLTNLNQTIQSAGLQNAVIIQKG